MARRKIEKKNKIFFNKLKFIFIILIPIFIIFGTKFILIKFVYPLKHFEVIKGAASNSNVDPYLILAIIKTESGFNNNAVSKKEARGLMQIMDSTASDINKENNVYNESEINLYDVDTNITLGTSYFSSLITKYNGNYYLAICAYNAGMGNVDKWLNDNIIDKNLATYENINLPFSETEKYLKKVILSYKMYKILYN